MEMHSSTWVDSCMGLAIAVQSPLTGLLDPRRDVLYSLDFPMHKNRSTRVLLFRYKESKTFITDLSASVGDIAVTAISIHMRPMPLTTPMYM